MNKVLYFDVEWANSRNKSICQMGLVSEDFETGEQVYPEKNIYVNPNDQFDDYCVAIHNITANMTKDCKNFLELWPELEKYFINSVIVGYNVKSSDLNALVKNMVRYDIDIPELYCIDLYTLSRKLVSPLEVQDFSLGTLCRYFEVDIDNEHDAFDDACACSELLQVLIDTYDLNIDEYIEKYIPNDSNNFVPYVSTAEFRREINQLFGTIKGIEMDEIINQKEIIYLSKWKTDHYNYICYNDVNKIILTLDEILDDGIVTFEELSKLKIIINDYVQNIHGSKETLATQYLQGIISGIQADVTIKDKEIYELQKWLYENDYLVGHYPYDKLVCLIEDILKDNIITNNEKNELSKMFEELMNPLKCLNDSCIEFKDKTFCLSGTFDYGKKSEVEEYIQSLGGLIDKNVKKGTNYLVVGANGSNRYSNGTYGEKIKKAMQKGVLVIKENQLFD